MAIEDDLVVISHLSEQEKTLRHISLQYMQTFNHFQSKLQSSNEIFTVSSTIILIFVCMYVCRTSIDENAYFTSTKLEVNVLYVCM